MNSIGIYTITCTNNNKIYVGASTKIQTRWKSHVRELTKGCHINKELQEDWNKHGSCNFRFEVLQLVENKTDLQERELYHMNQYPLSSLYNTQNKPARSKNSFINLHCDICGCSEIETRHISSNNKYKLNLCVKHYGQMQYKGKITDATKPSIYNQKTPNEIVIHNDYAEILNYKKNKGVEKILIDLNDIEICKQYKWGINTLGYAVSCINGKTITLHRFLLNPKADELVDHINGIRNDNRRLNLRMCTKQQNNHNRHENRVIGVVWDKQRNKWKAIITLNNKQIHLGRFDNKEDAIKVRREAEIKYFGEFNPNLMHN